MALFDWLNKYEGCLDSRIKSEFKDLYDNHYDALYCYVNRLYTHPRLQGYGDYCDDELSLSMSYRDKKNICSNRSLILRWYEYEKTYLELKPLIDNHFYGFCAVCEKYCDTEIVENTTDKFFPYEPISSSLCSKYPPADSFQILLELSEYFGSGRKKATIKSIDFEIYERIRWNYKDEVLILDEKIKQTIIKYDYKFQVLNNDIRVKYYEAFLKANQRDVTDISFCVHNLSSLDDFIYNQLFKDYEDIKRTMFEALETYEYIHDLDSTKLEDLRNILKHKDEIERLHKMGSNTLFELRNKKSRQINDERARKAREEQINKEKIRKKQINETIASLKTCVSSWDKHSNYGFPYFSMFYYYPTSVDAVTNKDWEIRNLIWGFKADPLRTTKISKSEADFDVRMYIERIINHFFGNNRNLLTFVCVPASTKRTTELRYKEFSQDICHELNMKNAYGYIEVYHDKTPKHEGGEPEQVLSIDSGFFKDKYVILFDDILTSGKSLAKMKERLESYGATVIGCITIGITKHQHIYTKQPIDTI